MNSIQPRFGFVTCLVVGVLLLSTLPDVHHYTEAQGPLLSGHLQTVKTKPDLSAVFVENTGQFADGARFQVRGGDHTLWLTEDALWLTLLVPTTGRVDDRAAKTEGRQVETPAHSYHSSRKTYSRKGVNVRLSFVGANPQVKLVPSNRLSVKISYFLGNDPGQWHPDVPVWGSVRYVALYPGIDLEVTNQGGQLAQRLIVKEGAALSTVRLRVEGARSVAVEGDQLRLVTAIGNLDLPLPTVQGIELMSRPQISKVAPGSFEILQPFSTPTANSQIATVSSPSSTADLLYSTFLGSSGDDPSCALVTDAAGHSYVIGGTSSTGFPTTPGAFDTGYNGGYYGDDAFVAKLNAAGTGLIYATFLGGQDDDYGYDISVDEMGNAYFVGWTQSSNFPITGGAFDTTFGGGICNVGGVYPRPCADAFVAKLNASGTGLLYAAYLGANGHDMPHAITSDSQGNAYVVGMTRSENFPTTLGAFDTTFNGSAEWPRSGYWYGDAFVTKLNPAGGELVYSTYLGGSGYEASWGSAALLPGGDLMVVGMTGSTNWPTTSGAFDTSHNGQADVYVTRLNTNGSTLVYSTFVGGNDDEQANAVALDAEGNAYATGWTCSSDFPATGNAFQTSLGGGCDAFVLKASSTGTLLQYGTYLGRSQGDAGFSLALDQEEMVYVVGRTNSPDFPTTITAFSNVLNGNHDGFLSQLDLDEMSDQQLAYSTFLGGGARDDIQDLALVSDQAVLLVGNTESANFPVTAGAFDTSYNGSEDSFVTKIALARPVPAITSVSPPYVTAGANAFTLAVFGTGFAEDSVIHWNGFDRTTTFVSSCELRAQVTAADISTPGTVSIAVYTPSPGGGTSNTWAFAIHRPPPTLTSINPTWVSAGSDGFSLNANGMNFTADSVVYWNGFPRTTSFANSNQLVAQIREEDVVAVGEASITVYTPPPGGGVSDDQPFTIADAHESDDSCANARPISVDGVVQVHTFHQKADEDWISFQATAAITYVIEARVPPTCMTDVMLEIYDNCDGGAEASQDHTFSPDARLIFQPPADGTYYLHLRNHDADTYGSDVAYHLSVRALPVSTLPGALVLVAGRLLIDDALQDNIHNVTDAAYRLFRAHGYPADRIYYLATDLDLDPDNDGQPDVDALASRTNLTHAVSQWAVDKVGPDRAFTLYLMDHGLYDKFYLDKPYGQWVTPLDVDGWLDQLEAAAPGVRVNVVVEACYSGSFIDPAQELSKPGRVVIASTGAFASAYASHEGAVFSDTFLGGLGQGMSLYEAFEEGSWAASQSHSDQTPWLDDDGDGIPNDGDDGQEAACRGFPFAGSLPGDEWSPWIVRGEVRELSDGHGEIWAEVRDDEEVQWVWAVVYPPFYVPPEPGEGLLPEPLPVTLQPRGDDWYGVFYPAFDETGEYRLVIYAEDEGGLIARPLELYVWTGWEIHLPMVLKQPK